MQGQISSQDCPVTFVNIALPPFTLQNQQLTPQRDLRLDIPVAFTHKDSAAGIAQAAVIKDSGDDPDVTNKMRIEVFASCKAEALTELTDNCPGNCPGNWLALAEKVYLKTSQGIGQVTLPGLAIPPGEPAINPEPRKQIAFAAREAARQYGYTGDIYLVLNVPRGQIISRGTLNSRLGISGGISILGTHGTVRPYSHEAWQSTINASLGVAKSLNLTTIAFSTGRRSESALGRLYPDMPRQAYIQAADFAQFSIRAAQKTQFNNIIWACYPGKLLKLAQGLTYTHARSAATDLQQLALWAEHCGAGQEHCAQICALPTVQGAFDLLMQHNAKACAELVKHVAATALRTLTAWLEQKPVQPNLALCLFKPDNTLWLRLDSKNNNG
jgi:cobalt-precorrin-5B (C1)-methyltransferase